MSIASVEADIKAAYQRAVGQMVECEVIHNVSQLVSFLVGNGDEYDDELYSIMSREDWLEPALAEVQSLDVIALDDEPEWLTTEQQRTVLSNRLRSGQIDPQEFCEDHNIEPHTIEAYEHWIVSNWLADELEERGEMIGRDIHGLTIWGRTTPGQAISMDRVICEIYDDLQERTK